MKVMKIHHIYITKEGEPMANPEMEYPIRGKSCEYSDCKCEIGDPCEAEKKYHSGLLPFEDMEIVESLMTDSVDASHKEWKVKVICGRCCGHGVLDDEIGEPPTGYDCPICEGVGHFWSDCEHPAHYAGNSEDHDYRATFKPDTLIPVELEVDVVKQYRALRNIWMDWIDEDFPHEWEDQEDSSKRTVLRFKPLNHKP